jgi:hypothetical protein
LLAVFRPLVVQDLLVDSLTDSPEKKHNGALRLGYGLLAAFLNEGGEFEEEGVAVGKGCLWVGMIYPTIYAFY